ncbi:MAG: hypothetical protein ABSG86_23295 [Thermoguttaceae bacterium]
MNKTRRGPPEFPAGFPCAELVAAKEVVARRPALVPGRRTTYRYHPGAGGSCQTPPYG